IPDRNVTGVQTCALPIYGMEEKFGDILVPTEEVVEVRDGKRRKSERKFFPGYVLMQVDMDEEVWHLVNSVPRVIGFVGGKSDRRSEERRVGRGGRWWRGG